MKTLKGCFSLSNSPPNLKTLFGTIATLESCYTTYVLGQQYCASDLDCPCSFCDIISRVCLPCSPSQIQQQLTSCFENEFPPSVEAIARAKWGLPEATNQQFLEAVAIKTLSKQCIAPNGTCLGLNETQCLADGYCRTNSTGFFEITSEGDCGGTANFGGRCELCNKAGSCEGFPFPSVCAVNDGRINNIAYCEALSNIASIHNFVPNTYIWNDVMNLFAIPFRFSDFSNCQKKKGVIRT